MLNVQMYTTSTKLITLMVTLQHGYNIFLVLELSKTTERSRIKTLILVSPDPNCGAFGMGVVL